MEMTSSNSLISTFLTTLKLLLPAIVPSWNFFDFIAPSPRVQFSLLKTSSDSSTKEQPTEWHEFRPRPEHVSFITMLRRLFWNPNWNESLFVMSCAECLMDNPTAHSENEILKRVIQYVKDNPSAFSFYMGKADSTQIQFRLLFVQRQGEQLQQDIAFISRIAAFNEPTLKVNNP